jgi:hypothetical protein
LYPLNVIPEGKSKMLFEDYLRGLKWSFRQVFKQQIN